jgi:hypothetical protein
MFAAQEAYDAALRIEKMGRAGDITDFDDAWQVLQTSIDRLIIAFDREFAGARKS